MPAMAERILPDSTKKKTPAERLGFSLERGAKSLGLERRNGVSREITEDEFA